LTDRSIEIPIINHYWRLNADILEIGNVTNHYYSYFTKINNFFNKIVVDKYEKASGVINEDILYFKPFDQFDFIYSISTFEHVEKCLAAIEYVYNMLLRKAGVFIITAPLGYSREFDDIIFNQNLSVLLPNSSVKLYTFKRLSEIKWKQIVTLMKFKSKINYDSKFKGTKYLIILEISKKASSKENVS
jgi:hypothetical protein